MPYLAAAQMLHTDYLWNTLLPTRQIPWEAPLAPCFEESPKQIITPNGLKARVL